MGRKYEADFPPSVTLSAAERRSAAELAEQERAFERQRRLASQTAFDATAPERIRIWERLHALRLPGSPTHPLVAIIAAQTELTVSDIKDEQQRRRVQSDPERVLP